MIKLKERMDLFNKRWDIEKTDEIDEFDRFKTRIMNISINIDSLIKRSEYVKFYQYFWINPEIDMGNVWNWYRNIPVTIITKISNDNSIEDLLSTIEVIFWLEFDGSWKEKYYTDIKNAIWYSNLNISIAKWIDWDISLYPKWEEKLDKELVDNVFSFLSWPSNQHFLEALQFYQDKKYEKTAESLRRSLEEYLRILLENKKWLDVNIKELGKKIKDDTSSKIRNIIMQIFNYLDEYFNENSKHNDWVSEEDAEFLIYQVALLMRYIKVILSK